MAKDSYFIGIDLGGTKVNAALVRPGGAIVRGCKKRTPGADNKQRGEMVHKAILASTEELIDFATKRCNAKVSAIGLAVPGPVNYADNTVPFMPNLDIGGADLAKSLAKETSLPVKLANDVDAITVGEGWFGPAANNVHTFVDIAVGTGIGGGILIDGKLYSAAAGSSAEIGHMMLDPDGPTCGCGNSGCLETFASRSAIETMVWEHIKSGKPTVITELLEPEETRIRSGILAKALKAGDKAVEKALTSAARALGRACITLKHLLSPEVIVLGGGVVDACGTFMLPLVQKVVDESNFMAAHKMRIILSILGDDAGVIGAAAMAMSDAGLTAEQILTPTTPSELRGVSVVSEGFKVNGELFFAGDMTVTVNGDAIPRRKNTMESLSSPGQLKLKDVQRACKGGPQLLIIGSDAADKDTLRVKVQEYLDMHAIQYQLLSGDDAIRAYNNSPTRTALILLTHCVGAD